MTKVAVILSGCGVFDGSEVHESVLTLLALDSRDIDYQCFAPDINQHHVINHLTQEEMKETRNVLIESARIARGEVKPLEELQAEQFNACVIPGGFGAAKNLCDFALKGPDMTVNPTLKQKLQAFKDSQKPIAFLCIAPTMIPKCFEGTIDCTIGNDQETANAISQMGGHHVECAVDDFIFDEKNKILSSPAYMLAHRISQAATGIDKTIAKLLELA